MVFCIKCWAFAGSSNSLFANYYIYLNLVKTPSLLMKTEEVNPVTGISHIIYMINNQRITVQLYHILFSEKSPHAMKPLTMTLNSKSYQKLHEVRIWKSGLAPADTGICDCDHLWGSQFEIKCHMWKEKGTGNPTLHQWTSPQRMCQAQWQDTKKHQGQLARIQHWGQQSMFQFEVLEPMATQLLLQNQLPGREGFV